MDTYERVCDHLNKVENPSGLKFAFFLIKHLWKGESTILERIAHISDDSFPL